MTVDDIALTLIDGLGSKGVAHLLELFSSAGEIFSLGADALVEQAGLRADIAERIARKSSHRQAERELKYVEHNGLTAVASTDQEYPHMLRECPDYPHIIYVAGSTAVLDGKNISMVGTRQNSQYGSRISNVLVGQIAEAMKDAVIVSGLAFGTDFNCHRAALDYGLKTVAVVANALPDVTPAQNRRIADEIIASGGAIVSELHSQSKQNGNFYHSRNRIIAAMSEGTVVVESPLEGGSLITAEYAYAYNRTLMAVPGRTDDRCSLGSNLLIKRRKAAMVCSGRDILHELGWDMEQVGVIHQQAEEQTVLNEQERKLTACFGEGETVDMDTLSLRSGIPISVVTSMLMELELCGVVRALPGKRYERSGR